MKKIYLLPMVLLLLAGCQSNTTTSKTTSGTSATKTAETSVVSTETDETVAKSAQSTKITMDQITLQPVDIYDLLLKEYPELRIFSFALDDHRSYGFVYEVEALDDAASKKLELEIHPVSGEIVRKQESSLSVGYRFKKNLTRDLLASIPDLIDRTLTDSPNSSVVEWEAEHDDGRFNFEIATRSGVRTTDRVYNLETGELVEISD